MIDIERIVDDAGVLVLVTDRGGEVVYHNRTAAEQLGWTGERVSLATLTDPETAEHLLSGATCAGASSRIETLTLRGKLGERFSLKAVVSAAIGTSGECLVRIFGFDESADRLRAEQSAHFAEMLQGFIEASTEAMWCMEYTEPVDLTASEPEIVRQVFENDCHWNMCNRAMARLYGLPEDLDFNRQRVSLYFPRSAQNEAFVRQLIENNFHVDDAPSTDTRHDGTLMYVENSVRCRVENGKIVRMWGTARDITEFWTAQNRMAQREREVREILEALPDAVIVIDKGKRVLAVNPAFETTFGWQPQQVLGRDVSQIIDLESGDQKQAPRWFAGAQQRVLTDVARADGEPLACDVRIAPLQDDTMPRFVLSLRPAPSRRVRQRAARAGTGATSGYLK